MSKKLEYESFDWKKRFSDTAELLPGIICEIDSDGYLMWVNKMGLDRFMYTSREFEEGLHLSRIIHPDDLEQGIANVQEVMEGSQVAPKEYRMVHSDGTWAIYEVSSAPIYEGDQLVGIRSCIFDVSDRKRAEAQLRESEERFRRIFNQSPSGVALLELDGGLMDWNGAFARLFRIVPEEAGHGDFPGLFELTAMEPEGRERLSKGAVIRGESLLKTESEPRHLEWTVTPLGFGDDRADILLLQLQDITERKEAEAARLREAKAAEEKARRQVMNLKEEVRQKFSFENMVSRSDQMRRMFDSLPQIADVTSTVLINGESGTGKELVARAIHGLSPRSEKAFVAINCGALPDNLLESELFGYKAGAFTDAKKDKPGKFSMAEGGVIFLDEIGDISTAMQVKLLRVLQERVYEPLGGTGSVSADVRVIAATNRDLPTMVKEGTFRDDLFYRLNVLKIKLPPLRERRSDIPLLCDHFISQYNRRFDKNVEEVDPDVLEALLAYDYPGNIRELENIIEHAFVFCHQGAIAMPHLPEELSGIRQTSDSSGLAGYTSFSELEADYLRAVLDEVGGSRLEAAKRLGIHKSTLFRKLKSLGIG